MKLTILGNSGPYPKAGGACSGYLLEDNDTQILIDCGNGVLSNLQKIISYKKLDAIVITHLHNDHISDIFVLKYAVGILKQMGKFEGRIPVYTSTDDEYLIRNMNYNNAFDINAINQNKEIKINNLTISFSKMKHPVETYAVKIQNQNKKFVYSSDTAYCQEIIDFSKNADLLLCEAGVLEKDRSIDTPHLSAKQACEIANEAGVKRILLTHLWPEYNPDEVLKEATGSCNTITEISSIMKSYYI